MPSWRTRAARARYGQSTRRRRRARRRRLLLLALVAVLAWLGASAVLLALAAGDARAAEDRLRRLQAATSGADLIRGEADEELARARDDLKAASRKANLPVVTPLRILPFVGRQVGAFQGMLRASAGVVDAGVEALGSTREELGEDLPVGEARVELMGTMDGIVGGALEDAYCDTRIMGVRFGIVHTLTVDHDELSEHVGV